MSGYDTISYIVQHVPYRNSTVIPPTETHRGDKMRHKDPALKRRIKEYCEQYYLKTGGRSPSTRQIADAIGSFFTTVSRYLIEMNEEGMIRIDNGIITTEETDKMATAVPGVAVSGGVPCGEAEDIVEEITGYVSIPDLFLDDANGEYFILITHGDSMIDAGIDDGDYVILRKSSLARDGQIVAALLGGRDSTLKRYCEDCGKCWLWAENEEWDIDRRFIPLGDGDSIQGVAVSIVKRVQRDRLSPEMIKEIQAHWRFK